MALDFSKLHDAIGKVADLARSHADTSSLVAAHVAELDDAQKQVDDLVAQLLAAVATPAEAHGLAAVASALNVAPAPGVTVALPPVAPMIPVGSSPAAQVAAQIAQVAVAPVAPDAPVIPAAPPVAPVATTVLPVNAMAPSAQTFLPGDPRALKL